MNSVVVVLDIGEDFIPCALMLLVVQVHDFHIDPIDDLCLAICLGVECHGNSELSIEHRP